MSFDHAPFSYRDDPAVLTFDDAGPVCVMDAQCALCARGAKWIATNDHQGVFKFVPLQSARGQALMQHYGLDPADPSSWLFLSEGKALAGLDALMQVGRRLGGVWSILTVLRVVPKRLRQSAYRSVARNRYRWFGTADLCAMPDPEVQKRLLM